MSFLRELTKELKENAAGGATGAGAVAGHAGSLFGGGVVRRKASRHLRKAMRLIPSTSEPILKHQNIWNWRLIGESSGSKTFNTADVMSKLAAAEKYSRLAQDTTAFGLEDSDGNVIKVMVPTEQAEEFEDALATLLGGTKEDENGEETTGVEIAEVLFELKDRFEIVDVVWPDIEGDVEEEEEADVEPEEQPDSDESDDDQSDDGDIEDELEDPTEEPQDEPSMEPAGGAESALQQVIDMMKADAEARKAESEAREAEAEARAAEAAAHAAAAKVRQEEEILDMEAYNRNKKEQEKEAKRLADLAKFKHEKASDAEAQMAANADLGVSKDELMKMILDYLKAN